MTPEQISIAIFRHLHPHKDATETLCRYCFGKGKWGLHGLCKCENCEGTGHVKPIYIGPNYHGDLNAMSQAKAALNEIEKCRYLVWLQDGNREESPDFAIAFATAPQEAKAFLKAVGKYTESTQP